MNYLVSPQNLVFRAKGYVNGFNDMVQSRNIPQWELFEMALEVSEDWTNDWPEGQGFGSSDGTYMLKNFIDNVCGRYASGQLTTGFTPSLSVVEYSEADHQERVFRMEQGI